MAESLQFCNLLLNVAQMLLANLHHVGAWAQASRAHSEKFPSFIKGEAECLCLANEAQAMKVLFAIEAVAGFPPARLRQKSAALVKANSLDGDPNLRCQLPDLHHHFDATPYSYI